MLLKTVARQKQESVSLLITKKTSVTPVTPELDLVQEDTLMTPTRVVTKQSTGQIMGTNTSKPWDTSWYSENWEAINYLKMLM